MRAFFSTSAQTDVAFIFPQNWNMSLNFLCEINDIMMPNFLNRFLPERILIVCDDTLLTISSWHIAHKWRMTHTPQIVGDVSLHTINYCEGWPMSHSMGMTHLPQIVEDDTSPDCEAGGYTHKSNEELMKYLSKLWNMLQKLTSSTQ